MQAKQQNYSISEAARLLGLSADWLREGEKRGSLPRARRGCNGHRCYTREDIALLRSMGVGSRPKRLKQAEEMLEGRR